MTIQAFVGPSLPKRMRAQYSNADINFHPPLGQADLIDHIDWFDINDVILVADGYYKDIPSTWHKEILYVLNKGFRIVGCSSIGAMRAVECEFFGMEGYGFVYEWFKDGTLFDDSDVALLHDKTVYEQLTIPICDILATLKRTSLDNEQINYCCNLSRQIHFEDRTLKAVCDKLVSCATKINQDTRRFIGEFLYAGIVKQKQLDLQSTLEILLIENSTYINEKPLVGRDLERKKESYETHTKDRDFNQTVFFDGLLFLDRSTNSRIGSLLSTRSSFLSTCLITNPERMKTVETEAMLVKVSSLLFDQLEVDVDSNQYAKFKNDFLNFAKTNGWSNDLKKEARLTDEEVDQYIQDRFKATLILGNLHRFDPYSSACKTFYNHMLLNPEYHQLVNDCQRQIETLHELSIDPISEASESEISTWSSQNVDQLLQVYLKSRQGCNSFGIGSFLDFDTIAAIQKVMKNFRHELLKLLAIKSTIKTVLK